MLEIKSKIDLASLLSSRICHDLISPVGALSNGIEILAEECDDEMRDQTIALLAHSVNEATGRLQLLRLAFGGSSSLGGVVSVGDGEHAIREYLGATKVALDWRMQLDALPKSAMKLLMNMALVASEAIIRAGTLTVQAVPSESGVQLAATASGERILVSDDIAAILDGSASEDSIDAKSVPAVLAIMLADELGGRVAGHRGQNNEFMILAELPQMADF
jgi:histidine phosphotransferase ChpT